MCGCSEARTGAGATLGCLLFEFINGLLLLIDLVPEPGQLPVVGLTVTLHLQLQGLLPTTHPKLRTRLPDTSSLRASAAGPGHTPVIPTPSPLAFTSSASCVSGSLSFRATSFTVS